MPLDATFIEERGTFCPLTHTRGLCACTPRTHTEYSRDMFILHLSLYSLSFVRVPCTCNNAAEKTTKTAPECCDIVGIICGCIPIVAKWPSVVDDGSADALATEEVSMKFRESKDEPAPVPLIEPIPLNEGDVECPRASEDGSELCRPLFALPAILRILGPATPKAAAACRCASFFLFCSLSFPLLCPRESSGSN